MDYEYAFGYKRYNEKKWEKVLLLKFSYVNIFLMETDVFVRRTKGAVKERVKNKFSKEKGV